MNEQRYISRLFCQLVVYQNQFKKEFEQKQCIWSLVKRNLLSVALQEVEFVRNKFGGSVFYKEYTMCALERSLQKMIKESLRYRRMFSLTGDVISKAKYIASKNAIKKVLTVYQNFVHLSDDTL